VSARATDQSQVGDGSRRPSFDGFPPATFSWFDGLAADNSRSYFTAQRERYDRWVRGALEEMLEGLADELGGRVRMFRQNRDVRFSADKSPYKTTTYGLIVERPESLAPLYAQLSAEGLFAGSGYHVLAADQLARYRTAVDTAVSGSALERAVTAAEAAGLTVFGAALKSSPRGYSREHARIGLLRHKSLFAGRRLGRGAKGIARGAALDHARATWLACAPLNTWLDSHVGASEIPVDSRHGRGRRAS
jgi:uncharacterized protein (TIGR02453 family)